MKSTAKRTFSLLFSALLLIGALVLYVILVRPAYIAIQDLRGELFAKEKIFQEQSLAIGKVNELIVQYRGTGKLQDTISLSFPLAEDLSSIFNQLRTLAALNGLTIEIFGVKPLAFQLLAEGPLVKNTGTLQLSLKLSGSYPAFKNFLEGLETNIRLMDVQQIIIERLISPVSDDFSFNLVVNAYYQGDK